MTGFREQNGIWTVPQDIEKLYSDWGRPEADISGDISFQQIDLDKTIEYSDDGEPRAVIRMFGTDINGASIACYVQNFKPYFFVKAPEGFGPDYCEAFRKKFNAMLMDQIKSSSQYKVSFLPFFLTNFEIV